MHQLSPLPPVRAVARDRQILDAAVDLFFERGFAGTSVNAIGERCGVTGPAIYCHFRSKDEILATLFLEGLDRLLTRVGPATADANADLERLIQLHTEEVLRDRRVASVYVRDGRALSPRFRRLIDGRLEHAVQRWVETLGRCFPQRDAAELLSAANAAMGLVNSVVLWPEEALTTARLEDLLIAMVDGAVSALADPGGRR